MEEIEVDFDFCSMQDSDYFGILFLVKQIFGEDGNKLDFLRNLTNQILNTNGTVVKVDDSDPYAIMTVVDLDADLKSYFNRSDKISKYVGQCSWLVNDRLINMPPQIVPNLMRLVMEEVDTKEFVLYFCKMGRYVESPLELEQSVDSKKKSKKRKLESFQEFYFQPEDEIFQKHAIEKFDYEFDQHSMSSDAKRTFQDQGIEPFRRILILKSNLLTEIQKELVQFLQ